MERGGSTYIMTNKNNTTLYIGVTSDLLTRIYQHRNLYDSKSFTAKYNCTKLVWYEFFPTIEEAIAMEKKLKNWHRQWKIDLILSKNPTFEDLWNEIYNQ